MAENNNILRSQENKENKQKKIEQEELSMDKLGQVFAGRKSLRGAGEATNDLDDDTTSKI